ncbi:MAG: hypothetical protein N2446_02405 [Elusimicrobiales bacterium]|nr:hypothetical protein [Elusimicrobiales bacterium]
MKYLEQELSDNQHLELLLSVLAEGLLYAMITEKNKKSSRDLDKEVPCE